MLEESVEQHDAFGVTQQGEFTAEDLSDVAVRLMAKDTYIARLQRRIQELTSQPASDVKLALENGPAAVAEAAEILSPGTT
jgi:hypothetical protein